MCAWPSASPVAPAATRDSELKPGQGQLFQATHARGNAPYCFGENGNRTRVTHPNPIKAMIQTLETVLRHQPSFH